MKKRNASIWMVCLLLLAMGWRSGAAADRCVVHLDKSFYVNGEVMWYKLYLPVELREGSVAVKVMILDAEGRPVHYHFLKSRGESFVHGYYKVPFDLASGVYRLLFSGMTAAEREIVPLAQARVPIYNDRPQALPAAAKPSPSPATAVPPGELEVTVELMEKEVAPRDPVRATIRVRDGAGRPVRAHLSIAVTDRVLCEGVAGRSLPLFQGSPPAGSLDSALSTTVRVLDQGGKPLQANVLGVYLGNENRFLFAKSNDAGLSHLALPDFHGSRSIQYLGYDKEIPDIDVERANGVFEPENTPLVINEAVLRYLELSRLRKKVFQHRKSLEFALETSTATSAPVYPAADQVIDVQKYESFEDMATFFREVDSPLRFQQQRDGTYQARLTNPRALSFNSFELGSPLFVIDGKVTRNADFVARLSTDQVQRVRLYITQETLRRSFRVFGNNGVVLIETAIPDVELPAEDARDIIRVNGLQPPAAFPVFHPDQIDGDPHRAFFRPQLYWNPEVRTDDSGVATFTFHQSDDRSTFRIEVVAQSAAGALGAGAAEYRVE